MAAELEKLRRDTKWLSKKFGDVGQDDLANLLVIDAQSFGAKAKIARSRGFKSFAPVVSAGENLSPKDSPKDVPAVLRYAPEQIAYQPDQISPETKAYVGSLVHYGREGGIIPIFDRLKGVERIYTSLPEGEVVVSDLTIGGMNSAELRQTLKRDKFQVSRLAEEMMESGDFKTLPTSKTIKTVRLPIGAMCPDMEYPTIAQFYQRAEDLGLEKCLGVVGPHQRLKDTEQPMNTWYYIAMEPITDRHGPHVFSLVHQDGFWLYGTWTNPVHKWSLKNEFVFTLRKGT